MTLTFHSHAAFCHGTFFFVCHLLVVAIIQNRSSRYQSCKHHVPFEVHLLLRGSSGSQRGWISTFAFEQRHVLFRVGITSSPCSKMSRTKMTWMAFPMLASWKIPATCWAVIPRQCFETAVRGWKVPQPSPCSWWWRCKTPRYRCRGIRWAWSRPPPWSPPTALCWLSAVCAAEPGLRPPAVPYPTPPSPSPLARNHLEHLQDRLLKSSPIAWHLKTLVGAESAKHLQRQTHSCSHTLNSTGAGSCSRRSVPLFPVSCCGSWIDDMWLWSLCGIVRGILDRFDKILSLWQGEEASLRETKMTQIKMETVKDFKHFLQIWTYFSKRFH